MNQLIFYKEDTFMVKNNITIEGVRIIFRNFSGKESTFNPAGRRNFCCLLDNDISEQLINDGWNVKYLKPRDEEDSPQAYIPVAVSFGNPKAIPKIVLITSKGKEVLDESTVNVLDWAEIENIDIIIRPYNWELPSGKSGVKAYVKSMYVTVAEDEFEKKYSAYPEIEEE